MSPTAHGLMLTLVLLTVATVGCGGKSNLPKTAPVSGIVTYKGSPVENAQVTFHPESEGNSGHGVTDAEGRFILTTYKMKDGAILGKHSVTVQVTVQRDSPMPSQRRQAMSPIPVHYANATTSSLEVDVLDERNEVELHLQDLP